MSNGKLYYCATLVAVPPFVGGWVITVLVGWYSFPDLDKLAVFSLQKWLVAGFLLNSSIIFLGTSKWAWDEFMDHGNGQHHLRGLIAAFAILALLVCGWELKSWYDFVTKECLPSDCNWNLDKRLHSSELLSLAIFFLFLVIDVLGFYGASRPETGSDVDAHKRDFYKRCIWIVDLPVLMIVGIVFLSRGYVFSEPGQITYHGAELFKDSFYVLRMDDPPLSTYGDMIGNSFAVGAILGHILLSQIAFTFLKWEYEVDSRRAKELKAAASTSVPAQPAPLRAEA